MIYLRHYVSMTRTVYHVYRSIIGTGRIRALRHAVTGAFDSTHEMYTVRSWMRKEGYDL